MLHFYGLVRNRKRIHVVLHRQGDRTMTTNQAIQMGSNGNVSASKGLHIGLWVVQGLLAFAFIGAGLMKSTAPIEQLQANMPWMSGEMGKLVRFIGVSELLGGLGLILPTATRIKPILTPLAALGLATIMVLAAATHGSRGEFGAIGVNVVLGGLAAFVAWGRFKKAPVAPRA
jgi:putative oxidoreductase